MEIFLDLDSLLMREEATYGINDFFALFGPEHLNLAAMKEGSLFKLSIFIYMALLYPVPLMNSFCI